MFSTSYVRFATFFCVSTTILAETTEINLISENLIPHGDSESSSIELSLST